ncbi:MAG: hypothetical protein JSU87_05155 [Gemmatimonadota bacterium]|nr:MAG: hypothetical protein JSU87_05155 [Gemmatimonadota bacterium]
MKILVVLLALLGGDRPAAQDTSHAAGDLQSAHVRINLGGSSAQILASYRIERTGAPLIFEAVQLPGQDAEVEAAFGPGFELEVQERPGMSELSAPAGLPGVVHVRIRYRVEGDYSRIPVFVPNTRILSGTTMIRLLIIGASRGSELDDAYPRFEWDASGLLVSAPDELPRAVLLPSAWRSQAPTHIALLALALLGLGAIVYWATRKVAARRAVPRNRGT